MSDTPMPWDIPGAPHPRDYALSKTRMFESGDMVMVTGGKNHEYMNRIGTVTEVSHVAVDVQFSDGFETAFLNGDITKLESYTALKRDTSETLRLASELNEAVIAWRDAIEHPAAIYDCPFEEANAMADAAEKLTGHLLEVINNK